MVGTLIFCADWIIGMSSRPPKWRRWAVGSYDFNRPIPEAKVEGETL